MTVVNRPSWSPEEVRRLVESGSPGRRIFALTLMRGERRLRQFDVLVGLICGSMSAFEQYFALQVTDLAFFGLSEAQRRQLRKVLQEERKR